MKKRSLTYIVLLLVTLTSCSDSNDDNPVVVVDPIIGEWKLQERTEDGTVIPNSDCELNDTYDYLSNGQYIVTYHEPNSNSQNECIQFIDDSGSWEKLSEAEYKIISDDGDEYYTASIVFTKNNTIQTQTFDIVDGGQTYHQVVKYERAE